jgi:hypothetical protein
VNPAHPKASKENKKMSQASTHPDDPCPCNSGLRYGDCHRELNEADPDRVLEIGRRRYAERWTANAGAYEAQGVYDRLAEHLASFGKISRVIDVGCGRGEGLVALRKVMTGTQSLLLGLDENPDCLLAASIRLGVNNPQERLKRIDSHGREYDLEYIHGRLPTLQGTCLIQTDLLRSDDELEAALASVPSFDAVTL